MNKTCPQCGNQMNFKQAGISKKGRAYPAFFSCPNCTHTENVEQGQRPAPQGAIRQDSSDSWGSKPSVQSEPQDQARDKDLRIAKLSCLSTVANLVSAKVKGGEDTRTINELTSTVMREAERLVNYVYFGLPDEP